ncbi:MAG: response regulator [Ginsengibacter sp.]
MDKKKILVADDDPGIVDAMQILLEDQGYNVLTTMNGENVPEMCSHKPDLIFLDIWMSGVDGNVICRQLKSSDENKHIPVIMFSANRDTKDIALQCGANGFLAKPFEIKELMRLVHEYIPNEV